MDNWTRRDLIKRGAITLGAMSALPSLPRIANAHETQSPPADAGRERVLLDFGWRFALGHASDATKDFGYGRGNAYAKSNGFFQASRANFNDFVNYGGNNILVIRADATESEGWFYEGAGIYRHVWLVKTNAVHVARFGTYVRSTVARDAASLSIGTEVVNDSDQAVTCRVV